MWLIWTGNPIRGDSPVALAHTGRFLPYDKDRRWSPTKDEHVLVDAITHTAQATIIPTLTTRGGGSVKIYHYAKSEPDLEELAGLGTRLAATHGASAGYRTIWFPTRPERARTRIMMKTFSRDDAAVDQALLLERCEAADTFPAFAAEIGPEGFQFLYQRMKAGHRDGPILVAVEHDRIVGAVGPLSLMTSPDGRRLQPPAYFAVHPQYRGRGHGRRLWRSSMAWGRKQGAHVKILQASRGTAAEALYASEGLETVGYVSSQ